MIISSAEKFPILRLKYVRMIVFRDRCSGRKKSLLPISGHAFAAKLPFFLFIFLNYFEFKCNSFKENFNQHGR